MYWGSCYWAHTMSKCSAHWEHLPCLGFRTHFLFPAGLLTFTSTSYFLQDICRMGYNSVLTKFLLQGFSGPQALQVLTPEFPLSPTCLLCWATPWSPQVTQTLAYTQHCTSYCRNCLSVTSASFLLWCPRQRAWPHVALSLPSWAARSFSCFLQWSQSCVSSLQCP